MGVVYRAFDRERKIQVALKTLTRAEPRNLYRFKREFRTLADVSHPNLVNLYELHTTGESWFFTMELIDGESFVSYVRPISTASVTVEGTISDAGSEITSPTGVWAPKPSYRERIAAGETDYSRLESAFVQLIDGVAALHQAGKLHRDLKPSNVLIDSAGRVVLLDFGLAADKLHAQDDRTHDMVAVGTPMYMSPEQAADVPLTEASDWYSVGVMLYEALTGRRPFEDAGRDVYLNKQLETPPPPRDSDPDIPERFDDLCVRLLSREPGDRPTGDELLAALDRTPSPATTDLRRARGRAVFVGRQPEIETLRGAFERVKAGNCQTVFVRGESGMGKSALLRRFLDVVATTTPAVVLEGRCYEREAVPYKALDAAIDALTRELLAMPADDVQRALPRDIMALSRLFPVLNRVPAVAEPDQLYLLPPDPQELRRRAFIALRVLFQRISADRPVVLYIDDLQWGDADCAPFLQDLMFHPTPPSVLLLLSYRLEDEARSPLINALRTEPCDRAIDLTVEPLGEDEARALVRELGGGPDRIDDSVHDSGGSPFLLSELARAELSEHTAPGGQPRTLDELLCARIDALDYPERNLLMACAAAGRPIAPELALAIAGIEGEGPELDVLRTGRFVRSRLGPSGSYLVEPFHDRVRSAALSNLHSKQRADLHRRVAEAMETAGDADPLALVDHWIGAGDFSRAGTCAVAAAEMAAQTFAFDSAARYYELALDHLDLTGDERLDMRRQLGDALANAGRLDDAARAYANAAELADGERAVALRSLELEQLLRRGRLDEGLDRAKQVLASVGVSMPRSDGRAIVSLLIQRMLLKIRGLRFKQRDEQDIPAHELRQVDVVWSVASAMSFVNPVAGRALQMRYMRLALAAGEPARVALALNLEIGYLGVAGTRVRDRVEQVIQRGIGIATELDDPRIMGILAGGSGISSFLCGRWREALERLDAGERQLRDHAVGTRWELDIAQIFQTAALTYLGELREVVRLVPIYLREAEERGDVYAARGLRAWRSNIAWLVMDQPDEAEAQIDRVAVTGKFHLHHYYEMMSRAQIELYRGDGPAACTRITEAARDVKRSMLLRIQNLEVEWAYLGARAALANTEFEPERRAAIARARAREIVKADTEWGDALAGLVRACAAMTVGDPDSAVSELHAAIDGFESVDMALHVAVARQRLSELVGGSEKHALNANVGRWMASQEVVSPAGICRLYAPVY